MDYLTNSAELNLEIVSIIENVGGVDIVATLVNRKFVIMLGHINYTVLHKTNEGKGIKVGDRIKVKGYLQDCTKFYKDKKYRTEILVHEISYTISKKDSIKVTGNGSYKSDTYSNDKGKQYCDLDLNYYSDSLNFCTPRFRVWEPALHALGNYRDGQVFSIDAYVSNNYANKFGDTLLLVPRRLTVLKQ